MSLHSIIDTWEPPASPTTAHLRHTIRRRRRRAGAGALVTLGLGAWLAVGVEAAGPDAVVSPSPSPYVTPDLDTDFWLTQVSDFNPDAATDAFAVCDGEPPTATSVGIDPLEVGRGAYDVGLHLPECSIYTSPVDLVDARVRIFPDASGAGNIGLEVILRNVTGTRIEAHYGSSILTLVTPPGPPEFGRHSSSVTGFGGGVGAWGTAWDGATTQARFYSSPDSARAYDWAAGFGLVVRRDNPLAATTSTLQRATSLDTITIDPYGAVSIVMYVGYEAGVTGWERQFASNYADFDWVAFLTENQESITAFYQLDLVSDRSLDGWPMTLIDVHVPIELDFDVPPGTLQDGNE